MTAEGTPNALDVPVAGLVDHRAWRSSMARVLKSRTSPIRGEPGAAGTRRAPRRS